MKTIWSLMDNRRGSVSQARGVLDALDKNKFSVVEKDIRYTKLSGLPNWIRGKTLMGLSNESKKNIVAPFPEYVISISRRTAPIARYIKKKSPQTKIIQLMHPGNAGLNEFDLVILPEHDRDKRTTENTHFIVGCPHRVTPEYLDEARKKWQKEFADLPKPLTAVIVGGAIKGKPFTLDNALALGKAVRKFKDSTGGSILLTTSRRTGLKAQNIILREIENIPSYLYLWGNTGENPYSGYLACADNIIVTGDSVSMCCEATGTGKPIYIFSGNHWLTPKHLRFVKSLFETKCAVDINEPSALNFKPQKSLNAAKEIADLIAKL